MNVPIVIKTIVYNDLCIGCGLCAYKCPSNALNMNWNEFGFLTPQLKNNCDLNGECLTVCPFNPKPEIDVKTENELADKYILSTNKSNPKIGKYIGIYVGFSNEYRLTSSSGGIATYIFQELLDQRIVKYIYSVRESEKPNIHYEYAVIENKDQLLNASKTKYFPVTLGTVMQGIHNLDGKVAIVGVACFIKSIRLVQYKDHKLKEKIPFLVGIICGGIKSRFFTEYLASKAGVLESNIKRPQFRIKDHKSTSSDYSFGCIDNETKEERTVKMRTVGDMWGTGMFKANACDFCDDVTTELADISLGDAWFSPHNLDGKGTNVIVTRSSLAEFIILEGINKSKLSMEKLSLDKFLLSQQGSFNHRQTALSFRIEINKRGNKIIPTKRFSNGKISISFKIVQLLRMHIRKRSLDLWFKSPSSLLFDNKMRLSLFFLKIATRIYHFQNRL